MTATSEYDDSIRNAMSELIGGYMKDSALERSLTSITAAAVELVDGVDFADVMVLNQGRLRSVTTVPLLTELDAVQVQLGQGPCVEAARSNASMVRCTDLRDEPRWPAYAAAAVAGGVYSMLSFRLDTGHHGVSALNMFGLDPRQPDPAAEAIGALLATLATVALMTAQKYAEFETALASKDTIGQAKGILMHHFKIDATHAVAMLKHMSQTDNVPVRIVAQRIIDDG